MAHHILICDDEKDIVNALKIYLSQEDYILHTAYNGEEALEVLAAERIDLLLLDIMMPKLDGIQTMVRLREKYRLPVILLTAKSEDTDKILGLTAGADDYLTKPVDLDELLLHVQALLRRSRAMTSHRLTIGETVLDYDSLTVRRGDMLLTLPKKEFFLLFKLLSSPMQIFTRRQLMDEIWGMDSESDERTVDVHIKRLREKCEVFPDFSLVTVRGLGYKAVKNNV